MLFRPIVRCANKERDRAHGWKRDLQVTIAQVADREITTCVLKLK